MSVLNLDKIDLTGETKLEDSLNRNQPYFHERLNLNSKNKFQQMATIRNLDDKWIQIQRNTFTNWVNEQLKHENEKVTDLKSDLSNGVRLIKLVNILQQPNSKVSKRYFKNPTNQHQSLENITLALNAITDDGIKLVNIGNVDLMSGNLKLILGLIWHLILRYQIGKTKIPPKKLILAWIKSVLPQYQLTNLTHDLNDGLILAGIINYCRPDLFPDWLGWSRKNNLENCTKAMNVALEEFDIPMVVTPQNMSSPELDELSAITYLSYFIKEGSPGYKATLKWIHQYLPDEEINNFSTDWNDGWLLCKLAHKMGVNVTRFPNLDRTKKEENCKAGLEACKQLKMDTYVSAKELADHDVESIAVMATVVQFKYLKPLMSINEKAKIILEDSVSDALVGKPFDFRIDYIENQCNNIKCYVKGPNSSPAVGTEKISAGNLKCHFVPGETGLFELNVLCDEKLLDSCPIIINVKPDKNRIQLNFPGKEFWIYQPIDICIDPRGAGRGNVSVISTSPSGKEQTSQVIEKNFKYFASIITDETGEWQTRVFYENEEVNASPHKFQVLDANMAVITGLEANSVHQINKKISFNVDVSKIGKGLLHSQLTNLRNNQSYPIEWIETSEKGLYDLNFTPLEPGQYRCTLLFNNKQIKGSPIDFNVIVDTSQLRVDFGKCKTVLNNQQASFTIDTKENGGPNDIRVVITSPSGHHVQPKIINTQTNLSRIEYTPTEIGEYYIDIFFANQLVNGSPFKSNVFDPSKIKMVPTFSGFVDQLVKFEVDASQAGTGQLEIAVENGRIPCTFSNQGNLRFIPCFTPREPGKHEVSVKFNNHDVPGSPFFCNIVDLSRLSIPNINQPYPVYKTNVIELNSSDLNNNDITLKLISPSGVQVPISRSITPYNTLKVTFQPTEIGNHRLEVIYDGVAISGSPFEIKAYDASKIVVSEVKGSEVNKPCEFTIDAGYAGEGQLEIAINDGLIKNQVKQIRPGQYSVSFLPTKQDTYAIDVRFNDEPVPECPKRVFVRDFNSARLSTQIEDSQVIGEQTWFNVNGVYDTNDLRVKIKSPSGQDFVPKIQKINQDEIRVEWIPYEIGSYNITVFYHENTVKGTPVKVKTFDPKRVQVYNINDGLVFKSNMFCVDASQAGEGSLEIGISCNGQYIPNQVKPIGNSKFEVHFMPQEAVIHYANISFNSYPVKNSPFAIKIIDTNLVIAQGKGLNSALVNSTCSFEILTGNASGGSLRATITGPKGENVPLRLFQKPNGDYTCEYTPYSSGSHQIDVLYSNQPISGSPFYVKVFDPHSVEITKLPSELAIESSNLIEVDLTKAGNVNFDVKITSPTGLDVPVNIEGHSLKKINFNPKEYGSYRIAMQIDEQNLIGTPLYLNCTDAVLPSAHGEGLLHGIEDKPAFFFVDSQGLKGNLEVNIEGPQHFTKNTIERQLDGSYMVKYTPVEVGLFKIFIKWNGKEINGSPFVSYVLNAEKVKVVGGWQSILDHSNCLNLKQYEEKTINFDTTEAGPGTLTCSIIAPGNTKLPHKLTNQDSLYSLNFSALYEGEYKIHLFWDKQVVPNTPIIARTTHSSDFNRVEVNGYGIHEAKINQETDFIVDGSRAGDLHGQPEIRFTGTRCDIDVRMNQISHNVYRCSYIAQIPGAYLLSIKWNERQVGDSPYKVNVGMNSDPSKVIVSGDGIKMGIIGQDIKALIDTRRAGPGELTAHCMGPQKVAFCEFFDHKDGTFTLFVKPQESGKHVLQIKYNDEHVPGSPFIIKIAGPPDATKVRVFGPGICYGVLNKFKSKFICETKGAGAGQLTVRIRGPKGAFRVEMQRESQRDRTIYCKFDPTEAGDYQINVKWSGQHVPGSPFNVHIFKNDDELEQFLRSNPEAAYAIQQQEMQNQLIS